MKYLYKIGMGIIPCLICFGGVSQDLSVQLIDQSSLEVGGLFFEGDRGVTYQFSNRITPHGDCIDVVNGYVFVTWYKGGMNNRNLMLSRKNTNDPNGKWITIEFPHRHIGYRGDPTIGDSHNTAAIGICTIDSTIHLLYDMHAYSQSSYPNNFFNYSVSIKSAAFVSDEEFTLSLFKSKQNHLKPEENYDRVTYPALMRADDGSLIARYRVGGSGNGDILMSNYDGQQWSDNWLYADGTIPRPDRYSLYGGEKFLNGRFYSCFSIRYADNPNFTNNSGFYLAYTDDIPTDIAQGWFNADGSAITLPIMKADIVQVAEPSLDYGTSAAPRTSFDPSFTVTQNGAIHIITRVDNTNVHYYRPAGASSFMSSGGGLIPNPQVRGDIFSFRGHVFMVELLAGKPMVKTTPEGLNNWRIIDPNSQETNRYKHFDAILDGDKLFVYLMEDMNGDSRPLHLYTYKLSEDPSGEGGRDTTLIRVEAEDYDAGGPNVGYFDNTPGNSGGVYRTDDVDIEATSTASNGYCVASFSGGEWLKYTVDIPEEGTYEFSYFAANRNRDDASIDVEVNGVLYQDVVVTQTFDWSVFLESTLTGIRLNRGENEIIITQKKSLSNTPDKIEFRPISTTTANLNNSILDRLVVYPNPNTGIIYLQGPDDPIEYALISIDGRVLLSGQLEKGRIDLSGHDQGVYLLQLKVGAKAVTQKVVIQ